MTTLILKDRVKHAASLSVGGDIILGAAAEGYASFDYGWPPADSETPYILENASGDWEIGWLRMSPGEDQTRNPTSWSPSLDGDYGFPGGATGLTIYQGVTKSQVWHIGNHDGSVSAAGASTEGGVGYNLAIGPGSTTSTGYNNIALGRNASTGTGDRGIAIGFDARTTYPTEVAVGSSLFGALRTVPVQVSYLPGDPTARFTSTSGGAIDLGAFASFNLNEAGTLRVTGTIRSWKSADASKASAQVHAVDYLLEVSYSGGMVVEVLGTPSFTLLGAGASPIACTLGVHATFGGPTIYAASGDHVKARGMLQITTLPSFGG